MFLARVDFSRIQAIVDVTINSMSNNYISVEKINKIYFLAEGYDVEEIKDMLLNMSPVYYGLDNHGRHDTYGWIHIGKNIQEAKHYLAKEIFDRDILKLRR